MKCLIIGGYVDGKPIQKFRNDCIKIGEFLCNKGHSLILCSPFKDSADYWVLKGYSSKKKFDKNQKIEMHFIENNYVLKEVKKIESEFNLNNIIPIAHPGTNKKEKSSISYSWLLCQLEALETCNFIITIGGKTDGAANMLLLLAQSKQKIIIPLPSYGGAALNCYNRNKYYLLDKLEEDYLLLNNGTEILESNNLKNFLELNGIGGGEKGRKSIKTTKFFISYPRARPEEADYIETLLRRRNLDVFRDESAFGAGSSIPQNIKEAIYSANVFIAIWCTEYACSPWCFDEFELALDRYEKGKMDLWIFCLDGIRIVPKRARKLLYYDISSRDDIEGKILRLLENI